jgi:hypothetical protein
MTFKDDDCNTFVGKLCSDDLWFSAPEIGSAIVISMVPVPSGMANRSIHDAEIKITTNDRRVFVLATDVVIEPPSVNAIGQRKPRAFAFSTSHCFSLAEIEGASIKLKISKASKSASAEVERFRRALGQKIN